MEQFPIEFVSNIASIVLVVILVINYFKHKKRVDVIQQLDSLKVENQLTQQDVSYIYENEREYKEKAEKAEGFAKLLNPIFILIVGILFIYLPFSDAMIHLNVFVVAFIFIQLDKINKKNTYLLLKELKKDIKKEEN
jgi:fumarate reductase subunit D